MITANGRYSIPIEAYHHDPKLCDGPSISASGLKVIDACPELYWATSPLNPKRFPPKETKAFDAGRASHALTLGEPEFAKYFIVSPYAEFRTNEAKAWRDSQTLTILKPDEFETVIAMADAQRANPAVMNAFIDGEPEVSLVYKDKETGVYLKSRPDWLPHNPARRFIVDFKTTVSIEPRKLSSDAFKFGYHIQAALQVDAVEAVLGIKPIGIGHVVQEKSVPYMADLRLFTPEQIGYGRKIYRRALRTFADCLSSGKWPGYTDGASYFQTPRWVESEIEEQGYDDE